MGIGAALELGLERALPVLRVLFAASTNFKSFILKIDKSG